jgi:hypothetical protein
MSKKITGLRSKDYGETEARLAQDPIVIAMAKGLAGVPREELVHVDEDGDEGGARFEFMQSANAEYRERGGKDGGHIGAVANALLLVLEADPPVAPAPTVVYHASRDSLNARSDEDTAMAHESVVSNEPDFAKAKQALVAHMVKEAQYLAKEYGPDAFYKVNRGGNEWAEKRVAGLMEQATKVMWASKDGFEGEGAWKQMAFDVGSLRFQLVRVEKG